MARKTITIKGNGIRKEADAGGTITPGHLIDWSGADLVVHATAGGNAQKMFALEADLVGDGIEVDYAANGRVQYSVFQAGEEVYAWLAAGESVVKGDYLESNGAGLLRKHVAEVGSGAAAVVTKQIVARAHEILDLSASGVAAARIIVEII